ncbi:CBS domain-containing protein [Desulfotomaculum copahuensis]|uniref:CBS domain-containing protein n=1 Tax=Desulfotomaculum copahuensis TaxID=1838280 RepID=A0A1B7LD21_9FIRM|nr:CBS domain-containing protein [Desulfotomaculum copahuensis]OAT80817.1 hypothetical protein A6M21_12560 [Desulfotomaculum copahuensis]
MPSDRRVREIMVSLRDYSAVQAEAPLAEAIRALRESLHQEGRVWYGFHSVLVLDHRQQLVGLLTLRSLLRAIELAELRHDSQLKGSSWGWYYANRVQKNSGLRVKDIMRPLTLATVESEETVFQAAVKMVAHRVNSLPVLEKGRVTGIVRTIDVFQVIGELLSD